MKIVDRKGKRRDAALAPEWWFSGNLDHQFTMAGMH
jgi:hypothetical protein